jgi:tetrapyrrole methylase family protein/MazG family protein
MIENKIPDLTRFSKYTASLAKQFSGSFDSGIQLIPAHALEEKHFLPVTSGLPVLIDCKSDSISYTKLQKLLEFCYPTDMKIFALPAQQDGKQEWIKLEISQLGTSQNALQALYIPINPNHASLEEFMEVIAHLRAPNGCPWDRKQTHASLRQYLLEETYEALEALDGEDLPGLKEELGDLLLQIALHAQIASENGTFTIADVLSSINNKIVSRHPHVFSDVKVKDEHDVVKNWEKLKEIERAENGREENKGLLDGIPLILPSLSQAQIIQERAARVGFDWPEIAPVVDKVMEEMNEVEEASTDIERAEELGDLLFAAVNLVRWYKVDAESALRQTNLKFRRRFSYLEERSKAEGKELQKMTLEEMDALWDEAKRQEHNS